MEVSPGEEACTRMKGATLLGRTSHEPGIPSHAFWTNATQSKPEAWYASESRTCPASTVPRRDAVTSRSASGTGTAQQTAYQPASATPIRVEDHLGLVMHLAKRYAGSYQRQHLLHLEDLYQERVLGLLHAAQKFDARKGFRFSTYATYWIRWAIGQAIMNESRTIRLPPTIWSALHHLARAQAVLWQQQQREPSPDELAE